MSIHPTAIIDPGAELDSSVTVAPYAVIEEGVQIDSDTEIGPHSLISGKTTLGKGNIIGPFTAIGAPPQDIKYNGEETELRVGDNNIIREYTSIHRGTIDGHRVTTIGDSNFFMSYSHVAHDCTLGNNVILVNSASLGGHVTVGDRVTISGLTAIHPFCTIGEYAYVGAMSGATMDIPPYVIVTGLRGDMVVRSINRIGLKRAGFSSEEIRKLIRAFNIIFKTEDLLLHDALKQAEEEMPDSALVANLVNFFRTSSRYVVRAGSNGD